MKTVQKLAINGEVVSIGGGSSAGEVYSTEEQVIGTWVDGKPLYRKVYFTMTPATSGSNLAIVDLPPEIEGKIIQPFQVYGNSCAPFPLFNGSQYIRIEYSPSHQIICTANSTLWANRDVMIILYYTKTTDEATAKLDAQAVQPPSVATADASPFVYETGPDIPMVATTAPI